MKKEVRICDVCGREMPKHQISSMKISYYRVLPIYDYKDILNGGVYYEKRQIADRDHWLRRYRQRQAYALHQGAGRDRAGRLLRSDY